MQLTLESLARVLGGQAAPQHGVAYHEAYADFMARHCHREMFDAALPWAVTDARIAKCKQDQNLAAEQHAARVEAGK